MPTSHRPLVPLLLGLVLLLALAQLAPVPSVVRAAPREPATTPLPGMVNIDGDATGFTQYGERLYVQGDFSYLGEEVNGLTVLDAAGRIPAGVARGQAAPVSADGGRVVADGTGGWYALLSIKSIFKIADSVARLDANMRPLPGWPVSANGQINDMALRGGALYVAGEFTAVGGQPRAGLAALDAATGALLPWTAPIAGSFALIVADADRLYTARQNSEQLLVAALPFNPGADGWSVPLKIAGPPLLHRMVVDSGELYILGNVTPTVSLTILRWRMGG